MPSAHGLWQLVSLRGNWYFGKHQTTVNKEEISNFSRHSNKYRLLLVPLIEVPHWQLAKHTQQWVGNSRKAFVAISQCR